jgi:hypothetical protein
METRRLKAKDGTIAYYVNIGGINKMHNWDSVAFLPQGNKRKAEYYLFCIKHSKIEWEEKKKDVHGQPWHKTSAGKASGARA